MSVLHTTLGLRLVTCGLAASLSAGCAYLNHSRDTVEPVAVPAMRQAQMLNPDAGRNRQVVTGLNGDVSSNVNQAYVKSFERTDAKKDSTESFQGLQGLSTD